jgi:DNA-binding transcriptional MerR regulator
MKPHEVASQLNIGVSTVRAWSNQFNDYLSPTAQGGDGRYRDFGEHDLRVISFISGLKKRSTPIEQIYSQLQQLQADNWQDLPYLSEGPGPVASMAVVPEAAMVTQQQLLLRENADLRQRIDDLQIRLDDKDASQEKLLRELADLRERIGASESELGLWREGRLKLDQPGETQARGFWVRLFGRQS